MMAVRQGWVEVATPDDEAAEASETAEDLASAASALPTVERWPHVSVIKRVGLVVAGFLALAIVFLPLVTRGGANGQSADPIEKVFPTDPIGSTAERWRTRAQMPTPRTGLAVAAYGFQIYAIGGVSNDGVTARVEAYDASTEAWEPRQSKPTPAGFVSAAVVGDKIYVPGGIGARNTRARMAPKTASGKGLDRPDCRRRIPKRVSESLCADPPRKTDGQPVHFAPPQGHSRSVHG